MKITVYDRLVSLNDDRNIQFNAERMAFILEGLNSLEQFETEYLVFGEHTFSQDILMQIAEKGLGILPLTYIDGQLVKQEEYLTDEEVMQYTGITFEISEDEKNHHEHTGGCCCEHHH